MIAVQATGESFVVGDAAERIDSIAAQSVGNPRSRFRVQRDLIGQFEDGDAMPRWFKCPGELQTDEPAECYR